eukprot:GEMP01000066.1.p1 GENE.GEMP01000066.1~~GEMP01000066.1.p1  ORF type:complete len:3524 (+),score=879.37 GEMP01000066.1:529-10572(+)
MEEDKKRFDNKMMDDQNKYLDTLTELESAVEEFKQFESLADAAQVHEKVEKLVVELQVAKDKAKQFNDREVLFGKETTDYSDLNKTIKNFEPFKNLWSTAYAWQQNKESWLDGQFDDIDAKVLDQEVTNGIKLLFKTIKSLKAEEAADSIVSIAEQIKTELVDFQPSVPLIIALRNDGMRPRHWKRISEQCFQDENTLSPEMSDFRLRKFMEMGLTNYIPEIEEVADRAAKEFGIEKCLSGMKEEWSNLQFDLNEKYRNTQTYILSGDGEAMALLDEHVTMTQAMQFSAFKQPFEQEIDDWASLLLTVSDTLDAWLKCQRSWLYLQPIFEADDITKQLPVEAKRFKHVDATWRNMMAQAHATPKVIEICATPGLLDKWLEANIMLDMVQKGLEDYLETKRGAFARFYFLSNDELLEILSQTKDPTRVQPYLSKVFEAIDKLRFEGEHNQIAAMVSGDKEEIDFVEPVTTKAKLVEMWMTDVEKGMISAVRNVLEIAVFEYTDHPRDEWVLQHPAMVILGGSQVHWTSEAEEAIAENTVKTFFDKLWEQIQDLVRLVRRGLTNDKRMTIGALVVMDVHAKDVIEKLEVAHVTDVNAFEWMSQLRYYWETDDRDTENCWVRMVTTSFPYGYEYLGNSMRLVITPLTDMCYITLMGAQSLNLGGSPAGPAGTGKTESTKDLAKALAKQCVVFNCSPEMDYIMVGKFFKGLACCGAWCCFDEFNRIYIEVLSVIAQQLLQLFSAKAQLASYSDTREMEFEGSMIDIRPTFNVFITMNPGYAGRTELPDNLSALFRPMAMMVPDYALIAEIMLYAYGFASARDLARKMVSTFKLSSEQLSSQDHYDYGMRAVKTSIEACGLLKRQFPDMDENQIELRALRDVNVPKFLKDDLPLFENIMSDLFPGTSKPDVDYGELLPALQATCKTRNLQPTDWFIEKTMQLQDTIRVRHGMMLVGPTGAGKTSNYNVLKGAQTQLKGHEDYQRVITHIINPKAITQAQLYGAFDLITHEWSDGIAAEEIRIAVKDGKSGSMEDYHWIIFDGPVDALWIESMNTVLDDNKKLCLTSGEIISLTPQIRMMFEVEDLTVASPATVSRCGMVYMEPTALGFAPLIDSYISSLPDALTEEHRARVHFLVITFAIPLVTITRKQMKEIVATTDSGLLSGFFKLLDCYLAPFVQTESYNVPKPLLDAFLGTIGPLFMFCCVWGLGGTLDSRSRVKFSDILCTMLEENPEVVGTKRPSDPTLTLYDQCYSYDGSDASQWKSWFDTKPPFEVKSNATYESIVVPSADSISLMHTVSTLLTKEKHTMLSGNTGTGKSILLQRWLEKETPDYFQAMFVNFSAQTHCNQLQDLLDSKFEKRRRGIFGPPAGKRLVIFIDDFNMPQKEFYGAQPPIELIRQWMDHEGWYNRKELIFTKVIDVIHLAAMSPPGGGRSFITERVKRHYNLICATDLQDSSIALVFSTIFSHFLTPFPDDVKKMTDKWVEESINIFSEIQKALLPTPKKSHYTFNLRDIWKVFQGVCMLSAKKVSDPLMVTKCWAHEVRRVFGDRLINDEDRQWLQNMLDKSVVNFKYKQQQIFASERLIFSSSMVPGADPCFYEEVPDLAKMKETVEQFLEDYNNVARISMPLVMFYDACEHVCRISRVLCMPAGNVLLLGVGGSGRQSLTRLAGFCNDTKTFQIEIGKGYGMNEFKDDVKACLMRSGNQLVSQVFLFCDTQIVKEDFVEAINNILNSGDVPDLYRGDDFDTIATSCRAVTQQAGLQPTKSNIFNMYLKRVKANLHVVLAFSPIGDAFRTRLRMFPALVNCCTIDWFREWPAEALYSVGKQQLGDMQEGKDSLKCLEGALQVFRTIHQSVEEEAIKFLVEMKRPTYVTPTSYLELLSMFRKILNRKNIEVGTQIHRFQNGLDKLASAEKQVSEMEKELTELQPVLERTSIEVAELMVVITADRQTAAETKIVVDEQAAAAEVQAGEAKEIKDDAQRDLDEALPALEVAVQCLQKLKLSHLQEIKALGSPPAGVRLTLEAICVMFSVRPVMKPDPNKPGAKIADYWEASQKSILNDPRKFLDDLFEFDKDNIPEENIKKITPYIEREDFDPSAIKRSSLACEAICMWTRAMYKYHFVSRAVEPKRIRLKEAETKLEVTMKELQKSKEQLAEVQAKLEKLEVDFATAQNKQKKLNEESDDCKVKLARANKLIGGLGGEKVRWQEQVASLTFKFDLLPGDCVVAAGTVSYAGPYVAEYRRRLQHTWIDSLAIHKVPHSKESTLASVLGEPVKIQGWQVYALPSDNMSTETAIIMEISRRWPLCIDPQRQASKFIKNLGKGTSDNGFDCTKLSDPNFLRALELGIQFGKWVMLENIGEELDPALEPILQQQKVKEGAGYTIKLGDKSITYSDSFRFFLCTTMPNPHYSPEVAVKVTLLNFAITQDGLEDQMLGIVVAKESPELEERKAVLVKEFARMNKQLKEIEDEILRLLAASEGDILEDETLINTLAKSKSTADVITKKVEEAKITEVEIDLARKSYIPVAFRASICFFCIIELSNIDSMYQFSLQWYQHLFSQGIDNAPASKELVTRIENLKDYFTYSLYNNVCRALFEIHKTMFSLSLTVRILAGNDDLEQDDLRFLLTGPLQEPDNLPPKPSAAWVTDIMWKEVVALSRLSDVWKGIEVTFASCVKLFEVIYDSNNAHEEELPAPWHEKLTPFKKVVFLRTIRLDAVVPAVVTFVSEVMGQKYCVPPTFDILTSYNDSNCLTPFIFILVSGSDPVADMLRFADEMGMSKKMETISLGQGQGPRAARLIDEAKQKGGWVLLQNCHLSISWMPELERICEQVNMDEMNPDYRLWLTSMPSKAFPPLLLQNGIKMTNEPPRGLRANLSQSFSKLDDKILDDCNRPSDFKKMVFAFCFFHAVVQDRRKFGPIGWNIPYGFTNEDLTTCRRQVKYFLDNYEEVPYKVLNYLGAAINYGGRVTDDKDKILIECILRTYVCRELIEQGPEYKFSDSGLYFGPEATTQEDFLKYSAELPLQPRPEAFGMHENCNITCALGETADLLENILAMAPKSGGGGGKSAEEVMDEIAGALDEQTPKPFDLDDVEERFPAMYEESMNTVLKQETLKYNKLLVVIRTTLPAFRKALKGLVVMSQDLDELGVQLFNNQVPSKFADKGFLSLMPLAHWIKDLILRVEFIAEWIKHGTLTVYWLSGFFFPQAFFTGTLQNHARKENIAIDQLCFDFKVKDSYRERSAVTEPCSLGVYCHGIYLEGCRWDCDKHHLVSSKPKELFFMLPVIHFVPKLIEEANKVTASRYLCPVYKVLSRRGTLSTTGHSTNFVMYVKLSSEDRNPEKWTLAGVAGFLALKYVA